MNRRKFGRPRLLIVGCGDIGLRIVARLADRFRVFALVRNADRFADLRRAGAVPMQADLDRRRSLARCAPLAARVIHLAPPPNAGPRDARTRRLLAARSAFSNASAQIVYVSTTGVYGDRAGARIDETARTSPQSERAVRRVDAERAMRAAGRRNLRVSILRVPGIYAHDRLPLDRLRAGTPALVAADDVFTNHIHADDLARVAIAALWRGRAQRIYNAVDDTELKMADYFDRVAEATGLPHPPRLPREALRAALSPVAYSFMTESRRLANTRIKRELRVRLRYPTIEATLATIERDDTVQA
jgi:nucleoside-diphosphate-sugar epimerase